MPVSNAPALHERTPTRCGSRQSLGAMELDDAPPGPSSALPLTGGGDSGSLPSQESSDTDESGARHSTDTSDSALESETERQQQEEEENNAVPDIVAEELRQQEHVRLQQQQQQQQQRLEHPIGSRPPAPALPPQFVSECAAQPAGSAMLEMRAAHTPARGLRRVLVAPTQSPVLAVPQSVVQPGLAAATAAAMATTTVLAAPGGPAGSGSQLHANCSSVSGRRGSTSGSWSSGLGRRAWAWLSGDGAASPRIVPTAAPAGTPPPSPVLVLPQ
jgi:hypothetical protein